MEAVILLLAWPSSKDDDVVSSFVIVVPSSLSSTFSIIAPFSFEAIPHEQGGHSGDNGIVGVVTWIGEDVGISGCEGTWIGMGRGLRD